MSSPIRSTRLARLGAAALLALSLAGAAHAATITVINLDGPGEGFNDPTPAAPVGGNPGTTRGAQAFYVFQHAADIWASLLPSAMEIRIEAMPAESFDGEPEESEGREGREIPVEALVDRLIQLSPEQLIDQMGPGFVRYPATSGNCRMGPRDPA